MIRKAWMQKQWPPTVWVMKIISSLTPKWPKTRRKLWLLVAFTVFVIVSLAIALGVYFGLRARHHDPLLLANIRGPVVQSNFADPCYIQVNGTYYAFATNTFEETQDGQKHIQLAVSHDFTNWNVSEADALPDLPGWATGNFTWAPDVVQLDGGKFLMYYTAQAKENKRCHCIGAAAATQAEGPYVPTSDRPLVCSFDKGGAIDPGGFVDTGDNGRRYLVYKLDGNSLNKPGVPLHSTPVMLQEVNKTDGTSLIGDPVQILDRIDEDGPLIEAPVLGRYKQKDGDPFYVLFYSSNVFTGPGYDVRYAASKSVKGPYTRGETPLLRTGSGDGKLTGPGGLDVGESGLRVVFHSIHTRHPLLRNMWTADLEIRGTVATS